MKRLIPCFLVFFFAAFASAQGWRQTFDGLLNPAAVCHTPDGGTALLANSVPGGPMGRQIVLSKTDQDGRIQWQQSFGAAGDDEGRSMVLTGDGRIAVAGKRADLANSGDAFLAVFDLSGQKIWERVYNFGVLDDAKCVRQMPDGGFVLAIEADNQLRLLRTDENGAELWTKNYPQTNGLFVKHLEIRADEGWVLTLLRNSLPVGVPAAVVLQIGPTGELEFENTLSHFSNYVTTDQVRCKPVNNGRFWLMHRDSVYLLNADTLVLNRQRISTANDLYLTDLVATADGGFVALGTQYTFGGNPFSRMYLARFGADGVEKWTRFFDAPSILHSTWAAVQMPDEGFLLSGNYARNGQYFSYLLRTDSSGQAFTNRLAGKVFWDKNEDCDGGDTEPNLKGWLLRITRPNGDLHYVATNQDGRYAVDAGSGEHLVSVLMPNGLWSAVCAQDETVYFDASFETDTLDFPLKSTASCPLPRVDAGVDYWLHCTDNQFIVRYANAGTAPATDAAVTLTLDTLLTLNDASIPAIQTGLHTWRFELGALPPLFDSSFQVVIRTDCDATALDRTLCIQANIEPDEPCLAPLDGPLLLAEGRCEGDSVRFYLYNIGLPMTESQPYIVVEDNIMFLQNQELQLPAGGEKVLSFPANGSTWRVEVLQHPDTEDWQSDARVAAVVEGCSAGGGFSTGFVQQFSLYDGGYFTENECRTVVSNVQGLEKAAYPQGWNAEHLIAPNTDLEYALHFQNRTGDTIHTLSFRDTLDHFTLHPATILPGPASLPYQFDLSGAGVASFRFMGALPDSGRVWVKFRVAQQTDLPYGTLIYNKAWAYPDFSAPLVTNETFHTVGAPLLSVNNTGKTSESAAFRVWPVPSAEGLHLEMREQGTYRCRIADLAGRLLLEQTFSGKHIYLERDRLPPGGCFISLFSGQRLIGQTVALIF